MAELVENWLGALASWTSLSVGEAVPERDASAAAALMTCSHFPDITVGELGPLLGLSGSGAVRLVDRLEAEGLMRRAARVGRVVTVALTASGRREAERLQRSRSDRLGSLVAMLDASERHQLGAILEKMLRGAGLDPGTARTVCRFCDHRRCDGDSCPIGSSLEERGEQRARVDRTASEN